MIEISRHVFRRRSWKAS